MTCATFERPPRVMVIVMIVIVMVIMIIMIVIVIVIVPLVPHYRRLKMRAAAKAAPKPLSMFTTVIPDAQLVSIPKSAASP